VGGAGRGFVVRCGCLSLINLAAIWFGAAAALALSAIVAVTVHR
jgi:hypothetical protein